MKLKSLLLICCIVGLHVVANGQGFAIGKGASMIMGTASFSSSSTGTGSEETHTLSFSPSMDYFIFNHFFIGGGLGYSSTTTMGSNVTNIAIGPEIGYATGNQDSRAYPFVNLGWNYLNSKIDASQFGPNGLSGSDISLGVGMIIPLKSHFGIVLQGKYDIVNYSGYDVKTNTISLNFGLVGLLF